MIELVGDIFNTNADAICFTSNGVVKSNGDLVMGGGVAKAFADKYTWLPAQMGRLVKAKGNIPHLIVTNPKSLQPLKPAILSFPTKNHWKNPSDLRLIERSAKRLVEITNDRGYKSVAIPYPGIGLGGLNKEDVRKIISPILDDRFYVMTK